MTRQEKITIIQELFKLHTKGIALRHEYTSSKFDFLMDEGFIKELSRSAKDKAKLEWQYQLQNTVTTAGIVESHTAQEFLDKLLLNEFTPKQTEYLTTKAKQLALIEYFDSIDKLEFT